MHFKMNLSFLSGNILVLLIASVFPQNYHIYFGDLHSHTSFSDGKGTPTQAYVQARKYGADFMAVTDHSYYEKSYFDSIKIAADENTMNQFVAIAAFEMTRSWGHMNIFNTQWVVTEAMDRKAFYSLIAEDSLCIAQWNHPLEFSSEFDNFTGYTPELDKVINLLEIINDKRNELYESSYIKALDKGWHIAPAANSDNHNAKWIKGYDRRTAIIATGLTREELFAAIRKHRVYATENSNLHINFFINDSIMGSEIPRSSQFVAKIELLDPDTFDSYDKITSVQIIGNGGKVVASFPCMDHTVNWTHHFDKEDSSNTYYFLKTKNFRGELAFTAPIWITGDSAPEKPVPKIKKTQLLYDLSGRLVEKQLSEIQKSPHRLSSGIYIIQNGRNNGGRYLPLLW